MMVTGDHPLTAAAIARKIGLITLPTKESLAKERGVPISQIPPDDVKAVVVRTAVDRCLLITVYWSVRHEWKVLISRYLVTLLVMNRYTGQRSLR